MFSKFELGEIFLFQLYQRSDFWLFFLFLIVLIATFSWLLIKNIELRKRLKVLVLEQDMYVKLDRHRISSEIHDEVGAGVSALKLFAELASKRRSDVEEIGEIYLMVNEIIEKINEIIWSNNAESDNLESLFYYIEEQTRKLFIHSSINFHVELPSNIPTLSIDNESRRHIYLMIKEIAHNALKHSQASEVKLSISISNNLLIIAIKDNGLGFDPNVKKSNSMGMDNLRSRAGELSANLTIENYKGTSVSVKIPMRQKKNNSSLVSGI